MATLRDIRENEMKANLAAEAKGFLQNISNFTFILALEVTVHVFSKCIVVGLCHDSYYYLRNYSDQINQIDNKTELCLSL